MFTSYHNIHGKYRIASRSTHLILSYHFNSWHMAAAVTKRIAPVPKIENQLPALLHTHNIPRQQPHRKERGIRTRTVHAQIGFTYFTIGPQPPLAPHFLPLRCIMATPSTHVGRRWKRPGARTGLVVLWLLTLAAAHLGTCGDVGYVQSAIWGRPRPTRIPMQVRERRSEKRAPSRGRKAPGKDSEARKLTAMMKERNQQKDSWRF